MAGAGFDAAMIGDADGTLKDRFGRLAYVWTGSENLRAKPFHTKISIDGTSWYNGNAKGNDPPVGKKKPNAWGLYDMHGYVWEWCSDSWDKDDKERVLRGGSWADGPESCRSAFRYHKPVGTRSDSIGFRCVRAKAKD